MSLRALIFLTLLLVAPAALASLSNEPAISTDVIRSTADRLIERYGEDHAARIRLGVEQVADRWWPEDGDPKAFSSFCLEHFLVTPGELSGAASRIQEVLEQIDGHLHEVRRELTSPMELDTGPIGIADRLFANVDLATHVDEDLFRSKVAFLALLNFQVHSLDDRLRDGGSWDRETWARSRMMDRFDQRVPSEVLQKISRAYTEAGNYIDEYNIRMDRLVTPEGERLFPDGLRLISHWGLRDELASHYGRPGALPRQRMIRKVMERIVRQEIPERVIDNPDYLWCPETNAVRPVDEDGEFVPAEREPDTRYARILEIFHAVRKADPYSPTAPTFMARWFELTRQIPEQEAEALLVSVLASEEVKELAGLIRERLGRPLEPFDIWYSGFKSRGAHGEDELDKILRRRYPDRNAFQSDLPRILEDLGFSEKKAKWLSERIVVDPSRGAGHALGAVRREDRAHLRTRVAADGMDYKGYNIAIHELGHNVEQVFSLNGIDHWWLNGVPNNAFTEAFAFVFQGRDLELLGVGGGEDGARQMEVLDTLWGTFEIGGVALVDMKVWNWLYQHPDATPSQLRKATLSIARDVWNRYFAPVIGVKDQEILAVYSHMVSYALYLPDYPIGHIISFQVASKLRLGDFGAEFERMARQGRLTPDAWMRGAVGTSISAKALLSKSRKALEAVR
jgi:hypothetical protein